MLKALLNNFIYIFFLAESFMWKFCESFRFNVKVKIFNHDIIFHFESNVKNVQFASD